MEILLELLFEVGFQFVGEVVLDLGFRGAARLLGNRVVRAVLGIAAGFAGGYWWGARLTELGRTDPPRALWVSIGLAVLFAGIAVAKAVRVADPASHRTPGWHGSARRSRPGDGRRPASWASPW